jgi:hypothetical protein
MLATGLLSAVAAVSLAAGAPAFQGSSKPIEGKVRDRIEGSSWRPGCPVALDKLRLLEVSHWGFDDEVHRGKLVVHHRHAAEILAVMKRLYKLRYPIRRMELIDRYDADDNRSMNADNTSAFNCRFVAGTQRWSNHAYGLAIDINPIENPYVSGSHVSPPAGAPFADRSRNARGMIHNGDAVERAFAKKAGWEWLGDGPQSIRDYQHFSVDGN